VLLVKANTATAAHRTVNFFIVGTDGITPATGEANGQPQVSTDGGATWSNTGIGLLSGGTNGRYAAILTQTLVATAGTIVQTRYKSASTAECPGESAQVVAFDPYDAVRLGLTGIPNAVAGANGGLPLGNASGQVDLGRILGSNFQTSSDDNGNRYLLVVGGDVSDGAAYELARQTTLSTLATSVATLLARLGAITGTGVNTVFGFFKALLSKSATLPSDIGGTFDPATDSTEALAEAVADIGGGTTGDGDTPVNHNTGGTDNYQILDDNDSGVDNATIKAYLTSEFDADPSSATLRGTTYTDSEGRWVAPLMLNTGLAYTVTIRGDGFAAYSFEVTP
jgi:hypothetical protein